MNSSRICKAGLDVALSTRQKQRRTAMLAIVATVGINVHSARATYTDQDTFIGSTSLSDPAQWSTGAVPTATELAVFPSTLNTAGVSINTASGSTLTLYGISSNAFSAVVTNAGTIQLVSADAVADGVSTAPALQATTGAGPSAIDIKAPIVLGNAASMALQVATFDNTIADNTVTIENSISAFPGSTWGVQITGTRKVQFTANNYFTATSTYSGDTTIATGASLRVTNNILPHYAGRGNVEVDGSFFIGTNSGAIIMNGLNGASTGIIDRQSGNAIVVGAGDAGGTFNGLLKYTGLVFTKVGAGTQTLTDTSNANTGAVTIDGGVLNVSSVGNIGSLSALGAGLSGSNANSLVLDGGALQYTGTGGSSDRLFTLNSTGGGLDSSGSGALALTNTGAAVLADMVTRPAEVNTAASGTEAITMPSTSGIIAGMTVGGGNLPSGTTVTKVNSATQITVSSNRSTAIGTKAGADTLIFGGAAAITNRTLTFSGSNTGSNTLAATLGNSPGGGKLSISKTGSGTWILDGANTYTGLTNVNGGALVVNTAAATVILSGAGANIQSGELAFDYTGGTSPATTIRTILSGELASHFATGQITSSAAAADSSHLTVLGYADAADVGLSIGSPSLTSAVVVKYTYVGDSSLDGKVDLGNDFNLFLQGFLNPALLNGANDWELGDYNYDGVVNATDFGLFVNGFAAQGGSLGDLDQVLESSPLLTVSQKAALLSVVPEPTMLSAMAIAGLAMFSRRRRK